jgi:hypothetical protein
MMSNAVELRRWVGLLGSGIAVAALAAAGMLAACGSAEDPPANSGSGGQATGVGGAATGGAVAATGGTAPASGTGGDPCAPCVVEDCTEAPIAPGDPTITDFEDVSEDGLFVDTDNYSVASVQEWVEGQPGWWDGFFGGPYTYPAIDECETTQPEYPLTQTVTGGAWNISGTVGTWSGFGLWFGSCAGVDFSAYSGISFTISGTLDSPTPLTFAVTTPESSNPQECSPNIGSCPETATCTAPNTTITVSATPTPMSFLWTDLTGGAPVDSVSPGQIIGIQWQIPWEWSCTVDGGGNPADCAYAVNVTVDDIQLVP